MGIINKLISVLFLWFFLACQTNSSDRIVVARVFDDRLYLDEIPYFENNTKKDSMLLLHNFSNQWAAKKLLLKKAQYNFKNEPLYIDSLVSLYRESLLTHYYKEAVIQTYLDTLIQDSLIMNYYTANIQNFQLKEDIVKLNYIKIRNVAPNLDFVVENYDNLSEDKLMELEDYCIQFAERYFLGDVSWIGWRDFIQQLPEKEQEKLLDARKVLRKNKRFEFKDSVYSYFIFVQDFKLKGSSSPLKYVSSMIQKILLNKRKKEIFYHIEQKLIEEAIENNNFEIYE